VTRGECRAGGACADCDFCAIVRGDLAARIVADTNEVLAFFPSNPATLGHTLLIPKVHRRDLWELSSTEITSLLHSVKPLSEAVREAFRPEGLNLIHSTGEAASQTVFHFHLHVVPRWRGDALGNLWPAEKETPSAELDSAAEKLRMAWASSVTRLGHR
jgi:histidine triad (HIT) family protein